MPIGPVVLFGSGETSTRGGQVLQALAPSMPAPLEIAVLETPAGFEPNSAQVAGRVADFMQVRLQNHHPRTDVIPARQRGTAFSPDDDAYAERVLQRQLVFLGPGSPTYAARQLRESAVWEATQARHRLGGALVLASAAAIAGGDFVLPVYEIYKAGAELHWQPGLGFFQPFGLRLVIVPHWNNKEGGAELDTSRCFMGEERYRRLRTLLPGDETVVGIDEHTALVMHLETGQAEVMGAGEVTLEREGRVTTVNAGAAFSLSVLGAFHLPQPLETGLAPEWWRRAQPRPETSLPAAPSAAIQALVDARQAARARRDWAAADAARQELSQSGWDVQDTPQGPVLHRRVSPAA